jgi:hypothetical protein
MPSRFDSRDLVLGLLIGLLLGSLVGTSALSGVGTADSDDELDSTPPWSLSSSSGLCLDDPRSNAGWTHVMANGETWAVTLNATIVHPRGTEVTTDVSLRPDDTYEISFETADRTETKSDGEPGCRAVTTVELGAALSAPRFVVTVNGETVHSVEQEETVGRLYQLPNPINATG